MKKVFTFFSVIASLVGSAGYLLAENDQALTAIMGLGEADTKSIIPDLVDRFEFHLAIVEAERKKRHDELKESYVAKLTETAVAAMQASKLEEAQSAKTEIERIRGELSILPDEFRPFPGLSRLRNTYYTARAASDFEIEGMRKTALQDYGRGLKPKAQAFSTEGNLDASIIVNNELKLAAEALEKISLRISHLERAKSGSVVDIGSRIVPRHLTEGLALYYSFDSLENSGLAWSKEAFRNHKLGKVKIKRSGWRRSADFSTPQSYMRFVPKPFPLGENWSIALWLTLPNGGAHVLTTKGHPLIIDPRLFKCYFDGRYHSLWVPEEGKYPQGWTFVCVTYNGKTLTLYVNGEKKADKTGNFGDSIGLLGNRPGTHGDWSMVKDLDDLMFYQRVLNPFEVKDVFEWTSFPNPP